MQEVTNYWDWVSSKDKVDYGDKESIRNLFKDCFENIKPEVMKLFWVDINCLYLNYYYDIPQKQIGKYLGISQLGVCKRLRIGVKKLKTILKQPEDVSVFKNDVKSFLDQKYFSVITLYYKTRSKAIVASLLGIDTETVVRIVEKSLNIIKVKTPKYYEYLASIESSETTGQYLFKRDDKIRNLSFDRTRRN